jgi:hypothetical protein
MEAEDFLRLQNGGELYSNDVLAGRVAVLYRELGITHSGRFASLAVTDSPFFPAHPFHTFGSVIGEVSLDRVLDCIFMAGLADIQNIANGAHRVNAWPVQGTREERLALLQRAVDECRGSHLQYVEARVGRPLAGDDFIWLDPIQDCFLNLDGWIKGPVGSKK